MNKVMLLGRLTRDPELKFTPGSGTAVTNITIAVNKFVNKEKQADFINVVLFGKQAEATANYMGKGNQIAICGRIQTRSYDAKDGTKRYITEVVASEVTFLGSKGNNSTSQGNNNTNNLYQDLTPSSDIDDTDIPF
ncbi:MAG: single-stranded DNA-binding protein [Sarcina sp.]